MRKFLIDYFNYSAKELRPLYYLIVVLLLGIITNSAIRFPASKEYKPDPELLKQNQAFLANLRVTENKTYTESENEKEFIVEPFLFDPNTLEISMLKKLGLNEKVVSNIDKYREAGGKFFQPEDMKIIYGMSEELYQKIEKWILIESKDSKNDISDCPIDGLKPVGSQTELELNSLLYKDLIQITGGDSKMTGRILNYKNLLGGYYSIRQLWEVYEMNDTLFNTLVRAVKIDTLQIKALSINTSQYSDLLRHPYLSKAHVNLIMKYREYKKSVFDMNEFISSQILPDSTLHKMQPYFKN